MTALQQKTYDLLKTVPAGRVTTYKALADAIGTRAYRAVGQFMRNNPYSFDECSDRSRRIPCHRVVMKNGAIGGFMGSTQGNEIFRKISLLRSEGVEIKNNKVTDFDTKLFIFPRS